MNSKRYLALSGRAITFCAAALALSLLAACEVTTEKIQQWKLSEKGPAKIRYALRDTSQKLMVRAEAAEALGDIGLFQPLAEDLKSLTQSDRKQILDEVTRRLTTRMRGSNPRATTKVQLQAKDTLFSVRDLGDEALRRAIDDEVVRWVVADWQNRKEGEHSAEKVVRTVGAGAGRSLADQIGSDPSTLLTFTTLLREVGDVAARDAAAEKLIAVAKQQEPPDENVMAALGKVGSLKAAAFLEGMAREGSPAERLKALQALAAFPHKSLVPLGRAIAGDRSLTGDAAELRDEAFTLLERIADPTALDALLGFVSEKDEKVRYRAVEGILEGFGPQGLAKLLESLPPGYTYKKDDLKDLVEDDVVKLGAKALPPLRAALSSKSWIARLVAARVLGRLGTKEDVSALEKLAGDGTRLRGWEGGATVGTEAKAAIGLIRSRK